MDARVNDFLNEIDEIAPLSENKTEGVWEKCLDEDSGYHYYWNTKTNEVTWDIPSECKTFHKSKTKKANNLYIPPRTAPLFPSTSMIPPVSDAIKIYKIGECTDPFASSSPKVKVKSEVKVVKEDEKIVQRKRPWEKSDSDDEKIILISSYGGDSDSEEEPPEEPAKLVNGSKPRQSSASNTDEEDDIDILTKIQKRATELKNLGGEVPTEVKQIIDAPKPEPAPPTPPRTAPLSLVAGYSDSEDEAEADAAAPVLPIAPPPPAEAKVAHSTLFPVTKPIDIKDFEEPPKIPESDESFVPKAFQRKRRIGVALVNTGKKKPDDETERKGLGFSSDSNSGDNPATSSYPGFKTGGVMFVKADVLNPAPSGVENDNSCEKPERSLGEIEETCTTLKEKLGFLSEGREEVSPVQVMLIQIETLYTALKSGDLKQDYLRKWLDDTCSDLIKLEKETTPEGWLLQWDRTHKRYYYQNATTGESQWEYPQADVTVCDEAMDICTTPPPNEAEPIHLSPPLPPMIGSPSPPPPPTISECPPNKKKKCDIPLPPEPGKEEVALSMAVDRCDHSGEPLPPGVDAFDVATKTKDVKTSDINDALNSFYSDIAAIETTDSPPVAHVKEESKIEAAVAVVADPTKKRKKTKVKLTQGLAMKKKGVSKLVEKWKNVQMSYND